jgi:hypothetical protein
VRRTSIDFFRQAPPGFTLDSQAKPKPLQWPCLDQLAGILGFDGRSNLGQAGGRDPFGGPLAAVCNQLGPGRVVASALVLRWLFHWSAR